NQRGARAAEENRHQRVPPVCRVWAAMPATSHRKPGNRPMPTVAADKVAMAQNMAVGTGRAMRPPARDFQNPFAHTLPLEMMVSMSATSAANGSQIMPCSNPGRMLPSLAQEPENGGAPDSVSMGTATMPASSGWELEMPAGVRRSKLPSARS